MPTSVVDDGGSLKRERPTADGPDVPASVCVADFTAVSASSRTFTLELQWSPTPTGEPLAQPELPTVGARSEEGVMLSDKNEVLRLKPSLALAPTWTVAARFRLRVRKESQQEFSNIVYGYDNEAEPYNVTEDSAHLVVRREGERALLGVWSADLGFSGCNPDVDMQALGEASFYQHETQGQQQFTPWVTVVAVGSAGRTEFTVEYSGGRVSATAAMQIRARVAGIGNLYGHRSQGVGLFAWAAIAHGMWHEVTKQPGEHALPSLLAAGAADVSARTMSAECCADFLERLVEPCLVGSGASEAARDERLELFSRAGEELQGGRPRPRINLLSLCKQVLAIYREGCGSKPSRKRRAA